MEGRIQPHKVSYFVGCQNSTSLIRGCLDEAEGVPERTPVSGLTQSFSIRTIKPCIFTLIMSSCLPCRAAPCRTVPRRAVPDYPPPLKTECAVWRLQTNRTDHAAAFLHFQHTITIPRTASHKPAVVYGTESHNNHRL